MQEQAATELFGRELAVDPPQHACPTPRRGAAGLERSMMALGEHRPPDCPSGAAVRVADRRPSASGRNLGRDPLRDAGRKASAGSAAALLEGSRPATPGGSRHGCPGVRAAQLVQVLMTFLTRRRTTLRTTRRMTLRTSSV